MQTIEKLDSFVLNDECMRKYLKCILPSSSPFSSPSSEDEGRTSSTFIQSMTNVNTVKETFLFPQQSDTLFWCYYILHHGQPEYEMLNNKNALVAKQIKIQYVQRLRDNKPEIKAYKFDTLTNLESNLVNDHAMNVKTFMSLCVLDKVHVMFLRKNTYFELEARSATDRSPTFFIKEMTTKYHPQYGICIGSGSMYNDIQLSYYKMDSLDKPIKALSSYKLDDLKTISAKLGLPILGKTKSELYESILHYFV